MHAALGRGRKYDHNTDRTEEKQSIRHRHRKLLELSTIGPAENELVKQTTNSISKLSSELNILRPLSQSYTHKQEWETKAEKLVSGLLYNSKAREQEKISMER